jgi:hypothetical protein
MFVLQIIERTVSFRPVSAALIMTSLHRRRDYSRVSALKDQFISKSVQYFLIPKLMFERNERMLNFRTPLKEMCLLALSDTVLKLFFNVLVDCSIWLYVFF